MKLPKIRGQSKEDFWNGKYPKVILMLPLGYMPKYGWYNLDVRAFFTNPQILQSTVKDIKKLKCDDQKALACLLWVIDNFTYVSDKKQFNVPEYWCMPQEALILRKGDCDDGAILLANLMLAAGIPYWKIRLTAGVVHTGEGHAYVTYFYEAGDRWVTLDWSYYPNRKPIAERPDYKLSEIYGEVWWSWNQRYAFMKGVKK